MQFLMTDFSFDINHWLFWRQLIAWILRSAGILSALVALTKYRSQSNTFLVTLLYSLLLIILLGNFPIDWGVGSDRNNYANVFLHLRECDFNHLPDGNDYGFLILTWGLSRIVSVTQYFFILSIIYVTNYFFAVLNLVKTKSFWLLIGFSLLMGFTSYNINTTRAGLAISYMILGLSFYPSKWRMIVCLLVACSIHGSLMIPSTMIAICYFFDKTRWYYYLWILSIPLSFFAGGYFAELFSSFSSDSRTSYLTNSDINYNIGFRIDFIVYSIVPLIVGAYYIFKKGVTNHLYHLIYNTYILTNLFWVLVIRSDFSDRFAYLSWCMIPLVLFLPLLTLQVKVNVRKWIACILMGEVLFLLLI